MGGAASDKFHMRCSGPGGSPATNHIRTGIKIWWIVAHFAAELGMTLITGDDREDQK